MCYFRFKCICMINFKYLVYNKFVKLYIIVVDFFYLRLIVDN